MHKSRKSNRRVTWYFLVGVHDFKNILRGSTFLCLTTFVLTHFKTISWWVLIFFLFGTSYPLVPWRQTYVKTNHGLFDQIEKMKIKMERWLTRASMINIGWVHFCDLIVCRVFEKRTNEGKLFLGGKCEKVFERKKNFYGPPNDCWKTWFMWRRTSKPERNFNIF
jgi:hypothetical protein